MNARVLMIFFFLFVLVIPTQSQDWTEVRRISPTVGSTAWIDLGDVPVFVEGDESLIVNIDDQNVFVRADAPGEYRLRFDRPRLGPIELIVTPTPGSTSPQAPRRSPQPESRPAEPPQTAPPIRRFVRAQPQVDIPVPPPGIRVPPRPDVLANPPQVPPAAPPPDWAVQTPQRPEGPVTAQEIGRIPVAEEIERPLQGTPRDDALQSGFVAEERNAPRGIDRPEVVANEEDIYANKPAGQAEFKLAANLLERNLYSQAAGQFEEFIRQVPNSRLIKDAYENLGISYKLWAADREAEALRQKDLRRSGAANEALDLAITNYGRAVSAFRAARNLTTDIPGKNALQLQIAESLHGVVRNQFQKGGLPADSPAVVVEYLKAFIETGEEGTVSAQAKLGIADYYRDLGDARLLAQSDRQAVRQAYDRAVEGYVEILQMSPNSAEAERALIELARLYDGNLEMRKFSLAVKYYNQLLNRFPKSQFAVEARDRARYISQNYL